MHTDYAPDSITLDYIENVCGDLQCALIDLLENGYNEHDYDRATEILKHLDAMVDAMVADDDDA